MNRPFSALHFDYLSLRHAPGGSWQLAVGIEYIAMAAVRSPPKVMPRPGKKQVDVMRAIYDYQSQRDHELAFNEGDLIVVLNKDDPSWWKCRIEDKEGMVPAAYLGENAATVENPLHEAAKRGNIPFMKELLQAGVSINGLDKAGNSPLHWAARGTHCEAVKLLLQYKPVVNVQNKIGDTPLHCAAWAGSEAVVAILLALGDIQVNIRNNQNQLPVDLATKSDAVASLLIQYMSCGNNVFDDAGNDDDED
ncbi:hypothetical protein SeMB42_g05549 [Synchytrium endobioticum]|uniref:Osteoclast-stimulating factor 1 n=1 Tax=Synchytrium endobioticum TaxID=286115 RepID=A0A507CTZ1_9FUNG|nr:hypothetical protein SeMB42_g05549 [Synchytrium endobioticum]TPX42644.1 hypothetical protein SeLEV6574_g05484 [Synchytrium endobioticum]